MLRDFIRIVQGHHYRMSRLEQVTEHANSILEDKDPKVSYRQVLAVTLALRDVESGEVVADLAKEFLEGD